MPVRTYTLEMGKRVPVVAEASGSSIGTVNGNGVQLIVEYSSKMRLNNVLEQLESIKKHLLNEKWPPA